MARERERIGLDRERDRAMERGRHRYRNNRRKISGIERLKNEKKERMRKITIGSESDPLLVSAGRAVTISTLVMELKHRSV